MLKNNIKKSIIITIIINAMIVSSLLSYAMAEQTEPKELFQNQNRYEQNVNENEMNQFRFKNNFQFNFQCNSSIGVEFENDGLTDVGNITLELQTQEENTLRIQINKTDENLGLEKGRVLKNENMYRYRYTYMYILNISLENENDVNATLRAQVNNRNSAWAYYDEVSEDFVIVDSVYEDGYVITTTNHFSTWIVVEVLEPTTIYIIIIACIVGLVAVIILYRKLSK